MRHHLARGRQATLIALTLAALLAAGGARAQTGGPYDLRWNSIDGGGVTALTGGDYTLGGTTGQPDAGALHGGPYGLLGGFWESDRFAVGIPGDDPADAPPAFRFRLQAAVPNPFNPSTRIAFELPQAGPARLVIYDLRGARVRTLVDEPLAAGPHACRWDGRDEAGQGVASGVYFYRLSAGGREATNRMLLLK